MCSGRENSEMCKISVLWEEFPFKGKENFFADTW